MIKEKATTIQRTEALEQMKVSGRRGRAHWSKEQHSNFPFQHNGKRREDG